MDKPEEPQIYVVGRQYIDDITVRRFLEDRNTSWRREDGPEHEWAESEDSLELMELGGRVCYMSLGKAQSDRTNAEYLQNIIEQGHGSVTEHSVWTIILAGISRSLAQELLRHRVGLSPSMLSQRYFDEGDAGFVPPPLYLEEGNEILLREWQDAMTAALESYKTLVTLGVEALQRKNPSIAKRDLRIQARESARSVLPNSTETVIQITINGRALRHIMEMRGSKFAEREIRRLAVALAKIMKKEAPALFADIEVFELSDGTEALAVEHHKA